jgi:hypothetical protein
MEEKEYGIPSTYTDENTPLQDHKLKKVFRSENPTEPQTVEIDKENIAGNRERTLPVQDPILLDEVTVKLFPH